MRKYHEVANIFPLIEGADFDALKADIAANGLREDIWLHPDESIVDGRNRYRACMEVGVEPRFKYWREKQHGPLLEFVLSLNLHRRHLSSSQRGFVALDVLPILEKRAKERQGARTDIKEIIPESSTGQARDQAAALVGTNGRYVQMAKRLREVAPHYEEMVMSRAVSLPEAVRQVSYADRRMQRVEKVVGAAVKETKLSVEVKYPVVYADPPWRYEHSISDSRQIENQYPTMSLQDICALPVSELATPDAVLFLWATSPKLAESIQVLEAWGFVYRTCMVWDKERMGMGYYVRQQHELLLIATRGSLPVPEPSNRISSVVRIRRDNKHSKKPDEFREVIESMYPEYPKIELFARETASGWDSWGNQVDTRFLAG